MIIKKNQVTIKFITTSTIATTITLKSSILRKQKRGQRQPNQARKQRRKERAGKIAPWNWLSRYSTRDPNVAYDNSRHGEAWGRQYLWLPRSAITVTHSSFTKFIPLSRQPLVPVYPRLPFKFRPHSPSPYPVIFWASPSLLRLSTKGIDSFHKSLVFPLSLWLL